METVNKVKFINIKMEYLRDWLKIPQEYELGFMMIEPSFAMVFFNREGQKVVISARDISIYSKDILKDEFDFNKGFEVEVVHDWLRFEEVYD